jgi:hypothetical protein
MIIPVILAGGSGTRLWPLSYKKTQQRGNENKEDMTIGHKKEIEHIEEKKVYKDIIDDLETDDINKQGQAEKSLDEMDDTEEILEEAKRHEKTIVEDRKTDNNKINVDKDKFEKVKLKKPQQVEKHVDEKPANVQLKNPKQLENRDDSKKSEAQLVNLKKIKHIGQQREGSVEKPDYETYHKEPITEPNITVEGDEEQDKMDNVSLNEEQNEDDKPVHQDTIDMMDADVEKSIKEHVGFDEKIEDDKSQQDTIEIMDENEEKNENENVRFDQKPESDNSEQDTTEIIITEGENNENEKVGFDEKPEGDNSEQDTTEIIITDVEKNETE